LANDFQEFKGQMLGTTDDGETKKVSVDNNGKLKVVIDDSSSESGGDVGSNSNILLKGITDSEGTNSSLFDSTKDIELGSLDGNIIKLIIDGIEYIRRIQAAEFDSIIITPISEIRGAELVCGLERQGEGQVSISVAEGTGKNYSIEIVAGEGISISPSIEYNDITGKLTITTGTNIDGIPSLYPGELETLINDNIDINEIFICEALFFGFSLPLLPEVVLENDEIIIGIGCPDEGSLTIKCIGDLVGSIGNEWCLQIVEGQATTEDTLISMDANNKILIVTVNKTSDGNKRFVSTDDLSLIINSTDGIKEYFYINNENVVSGAVWFTETFIPFTNGTDAISIPTQTPYIVVNSGAEINIVSGESGIGLVNIVDQEGNSVNEDNPFPVELFGSKLQEQKTQADAIENIITFNEDIHAVEIYHIEDEWQIFIVNGISITVPSGGYRTPIGGMIDKTVTIPTGVNCIVGRLE
jgi:hypothetical protein